MALDFPNTPSVGDTFTSGGITYRWDGTKWSSPTTASGPLAVSQGGTGQITASAAWHALAVGVTDGSNAAAGQIGEFLSYSVGATAVTSGSINNMGQLSLTAGDWDVWAVGQLSGSSANNISLFYVSLSNSPTTLGSLGFITGLLLASGTMAAGTQFSSPVQRYSLATNQTVYVTTQINFASGTATMAAAIYARRVR